MMERDESMETIRIFRETFLKYLEYHLNNYREFDGRKKIGSFSSLLNEGALLNKGVV